MKTDKEKTITFSITIPETLHRDLTTIAGVEERTLNKQITYFLKREVEEYKKNNPI